MVEKVFPNPPGDEAPTIYADYLGQLYGFQVSREKQVELGQFFTPLEVASFMASLYSVPTQSIIKILDPSAGAGILACALCEAIASKSVNPSTIELSTYEIDDNLIPYLDKALSNAKRWIESKGHFLVYKIINEDFVLSNANYLDRHQGLLSYLPKEQSGYDAIICNPPYFKIQKDDPRSKAAASVVHGQPNIYALFFAICAAMLKNNGEIIIITPRSYTSGPYFRLFRERLLEIVRPLTFHLFGSRTDTFKRDDVLQENLIMHAKRDFLWHKRPHDYEVKISFSKSAHDLSHPRVRNIPIKSLINFNSRDKVIHIPVEDEEMKIIDLVSSWPGNLHKYGMEISTGPVVPFRATEFIAINENEFDLSAPLLWMQNISTMSCNWPVHTRNKEQYIRVCEESKYLLVRNTNYVLLRRFSSKEQNRRITATPYIASNVKNDWIGLENHLNYIHRPGGHLSEQEAFGLAALLNCRLIDTYFRTFNGNTQVSATELRAMPLPPLDSIKAIGKFVMENPLTNEELNEWVISFLINSGLQGEAVNG